jgi:hypothetical protein
MSERKYGQRGYMEDDSPEKGPRQPAGPRERSEKPRGRGLGAPSKTVFRCNRCGHDLDVVEAMAVEAVCESCGDDVHTCTNCSSFDTSARFECRQEIPSPIRSKAKRNDCEVFSPKTTKVFDKDKPALDEAKSAFDSLFDF